MKFNKSKKFFAGLMASLFVSGISFNAKAIRTLEEVYELTANTINAHPDLLNELDPENFLRLHNTERITSDQASQLLAEHRRQNTPIKRKKNTRKLLEYLQEKIAYRPHAERTRLYFVIMLHVLCYAVKDGETLRKFSHPSYEMAASRTILERNVTQNGTDWYQTINESSLCSLTEEVISSDKYKCALL